MSSSSIDDVIEKIRKVIRLARKAGTDGERKAAEEAAKRLADLHGIALDTIEFQDISPVRNTIVHDQRCVANTGCEMGFACATIRDHFGVVVIENLAGRGKVSFSWVGSRLNIDISQHVFAILLRESRKAWGEVRGCGMSKDSFMKGWFLNIYKKLLEHPLRNDVEQFEYEKRTAVDFFNAQCRDGGELCGTENAKISKKSDIEVNSFECGYGLADRVSLNRPCENKSVSETREIGKTDLLENDEEWKGN